MLFQRWNAALSDMAVLWGRECRWEHGQPPYNNPPYDPIGQNLFVTTAGQLNAERAMQVRSRHCACGRDTAQCINIPVAPVIS